MSVRQWRSLRSRILRRAVLSSLVAGAFSLAGTAHAANLFWDAAISGAAGGGTGTWDILPTNWWNGTSNVAWNSLDDAVFGGTAGAVTVGAPITANSLQFSTTGYTLGGASPLTITTGNVTVDPLVSASVASSVLGNSQVLNKLGTGTLTLTDAGISTRTAATTVSSGTLAFTVSSTVNPLGTGAINLSGGALELSPIGTSLQGLSGRQFASTTSDTARINFTQTAASTRVDNTIDTTGVAGGQAVQWIGKLSITSAGAYTFQAGADDGIRLFIDGVLVVQNDGPKGELAGTSAAVTLSAGQHDVRIDYVNSGSGGAARFRYSGPDNSNTMGIVPVTALRQAESNTLAGASNAVVVGTGIGNDLNVSGASAINLKGIDFTQTQVGNTTFANGSTLSLSALNAAPSVANAGKALRIGGTATFGTGVTLDLTGNGTDTTAADLYIDGALSDGGVATTVTKSGAGRLTLSNTTSANNLLAGSAFNVSNGTLQLVGSSAAGSFNPIGSASVTLSGGNLILDSKVGSQTVSTTFANAINVTENATIQDIVSGGSITTLSGPINVATGKTLTLDAIKGGSPVSSLGSSLVVSGALTGSGTIGVTSTGIGTLTITPVNGVVFLTGNTAGFTGTFNPTAGGTLQPTAAAIAGQSVTLGTGGFLNLLSDVSGSGTPESTSFGPNITAAGGTVNVGRLGTTFAPYFTTPVNKTIQVTGSVTGGGGSLIVANANGYGLEVTGATTLTANQTFTVNNATNSNVVQGLTLSGPVSGAFGIVKTGAGTLALTNAMNSFGGGTSIIDIQSGFVAASSNLALGDTANEIRLNSPTQVVMSVTTVNASPTLTLANTANLAVGQVITGAGIPANTTITAIPSATTVTLSANATAGATVNATIGTASGFRATGTFATTRTVNMNQPSNGIEVTGSNTLTLNTPFTFSAATNLLVKNDTGTLVLGAANPTWSGGVRVNQGAVRLTDAAGAGTGPITIMAQAGSALQLSGGLSVANNIDIPFGIGGVAAGIQGGGAIQSVSGVNTLTGAIGQSVGGTAIVVGANAGSTLNINGVLTAVNSFYTTGDGDINFNTTPVTGANQFTRINGSGVTTLNGASAGTGTVNAWAGTIRLRNGGQLGVLAGNASGVTAYGGGTIQLDDTGTQLGTRLNNRGVTLTGGNFSYLGNASAASTETSTQGLTFTQGSTYSSTPGAGQSVAVTFATLGLGTDASATFSGAGLGTSSNRLLFTTAPTLVPATTGILARGVVASGGAIEFASYDATNGITAFAGYTAPADINASAATDTPNITASQTITASTNKTLNAFKVNGTGITIGGAAATNPQVPTAITLTAAGLLATGGANTISVPVLAFGGNQAIMHVDTSSTLNVTSTLTGTAGFIKADPGTLVVTGSNPIGLAGISSNVTFQGTHNINGGTLQLGSSNAFAPNNFFRVSPSGTLDLGANSQSVRALFNDASSAGGGFSTEGAGGIVTGLAGSTIVANYDNTTRQFSGQITGGVSFNRAGENTQHFYGNNTYTGSTLINGGTTSLINGGRFSGTSSIDINNATLQLSNQQGNPSGSMSLTDRINDAAPITLRSGTLFLQGRNQTDVTESLGTVNIALGRNVLDVQTGGTNINSAVLTVAALTRPAGATGVVTLGRGDGTVDQNGQIGNTARMLITSPVVTNDIIGPWAVTSREWSSYIPDLGVAQLNATGAKGYATNALTGTPLTTDNIRIANANTTLTGSGTVTVNTVNFQYNANQAINLGTRTLNVAGGGIILATATDNVTGTISNGTITSDFANGAVNDLYLYTLPYGGNNRQALISAVIANDGATPVRLVASSSEGNGSGNRITLTGVNTYTGGTVINGGTLVPGTGGVIPAGGITINGGLLDHAPGNQTTALGTIDPANVVTLNGQGTMSLVGNNTLAGLIFNNLGGSTTAPTVNTFKAGQGTNGTGTLTIGASGIVADSSNVTSTSIINGRIDTGASPTTITTNQILVNGFAANPLQATLAIQGWTGSAGTITKNGAGVLQLNAQSVFTGQLNVTQGGVGFGSLGNTGAAGNNVAGSRFSNINLASGTFVNLTNTDAVIGSLSGSGNVINVAPTGATSVRNLVVGSDNSDTTFSGSFARFTDGFVNPFQVNKIGNGVMTLTGVSTNTNTFQVAGGTATTGGVTYSGAGSSVFGVNNVLPNATLTLDNSGTNVNNRLGGTSTLGTLNVVGGTFRMIGNASAPTIETFNAVSFSGLANSNGSSIIQLEANPAQSLTLSVGTTLGGVNIGGTGLIRGVSGTAGAGLANLSIGTITLGAPTGAGTGANGTTTMPIRPDLLGDTSISGNGTAFVTKDSVSNFIRPLAASEMASQVFSGASNGTVNFGLSSTATIAATGIMGSLNLASGGGLNSVSSLMPSGVSDGLPINQQIVSGGILAQTGNTGISVNRLQTANNVGFYIHTPGAATNFSITGVLNGSSGGLAKAGQGTLTLNSKNLYTGNTNVNAGTLILNGGDNTIPVLVTGGAPTTSPVSVTGFGSTLDLNGNNQLANALFTNSNGRYAGQGGTLTNSSMTPVTFTNLGGSAQAFGGSITGNLNFTKTGNNALTLTNANSYTGVTTVLANTLTVIDAGTLSGTSAINLNYGGLNLDNGGMTPLANLNLQRIPAVAPVNLRGGTLTLTAGGSVDTTQTVNNVNALQGHNTISVPQASTGGYGALTVGNLALDPDATINLTGGGGGAFSNNPGLNQSQLIINSLNGTPIPATIPGKILGGNLLANNGEFVTAVQAGTTGSNGINWGVITMNGTTGPLGTITQDLYDATVITATGTATTNVRTTASGTLVSGGTTYNSLAVRPAGTAAAITVTYTAATDVLNINSGGISFTNSVASFFGAAADGGRLTAGGTQSTGTARLYFHTGAAAHTLNARVVDNAAGAKVRLVVNAFNTLSIAGTNSHTGGTVINGGSAVSLAATGFLPAGPAGDGLVLNNSPLNQTTSANSATTGIAPTTDVVLNGGSVLTFGAFANTLNSLTFNNNGGTATPTVTIGTVSLTIPTALAINSVNDNALTVPTIAGTALILSNATPTITTSTTANVPNSLIIAAPITSAGGTLIKAGTGSLVLSGANTFTTGVNLNAGTIILGSNTALGGSAGTLTMADGTALISNTAIRTITNPVALTGNVTFGSTAGIANASAVAVNGVILNGTFDLGAATRDINVNSFLNTSTIGGVVSGAAGTGLTKSGPGTLVLTAANTFDGTVTINGGTLSAGGAPIALGSAQPLGVATAAGSIVFGGGILQHGGTNTTDYSSRFATSSNQPFYIDTAGNTVTYASPMVSSGTSSLAKFGTGTLRLTSDTNSYTGDTVISAGTLQLGDQINAGGATGLLPAGTNIFNSGALVVSKSTNDTLSGIISGSGTLTKRGTGNLTLSGVNTFTGNVSMNAATPATAGQITITNSSALGAGPKTVTIISNFGPNDGALILNATSGNIDLAQNISFTTSSANGTGGILNLAGDNIIRGNFTLTGGGGSTKWTSNGGTLTLASGATITPNQTGRFANFDGTASGTVDALMQDQNATNTLGVNKLGTGTWTFTAANTYTLRTVVENGILEFNTIGNIGSGASALGAPATVANGTIALGANTTTGALRYIGSANTSSDRVLNMAGTTGGATVLSAGVGTINFTNPTVTATGAGDKTLTLGGSNTGDNTIGGVIPNSTGFTTSLVKADPGKWIVGAVNTYSGTTTVNDGTLVVSSVLGLANNSSAHVLMAIPDSTLAGNPLLTRSIGTGLDAYAGFGSKVTVASIDPVSSTALQTTADILMSGNNAVTNDMSMQWRFRTSAEANPANTNAVLSDVVSITGMGSDVFVLQMSYTDAALGSLNETAIATSGELRLGWNDAGTWKTATAGNTIPGSNFAGVTSWADFVTANSVTSANLNTFLGSYGVDPTGAGGVVWAVLDHNSEFAVIPEPSTLVLGGLALLGLAGMNLRRRRMQKTPA